MKRSWTTIFALLFMSSVKAQMLSNSSTEENKSNSQDIIDAQAIVYHNMNDKIFASILPYREKFQRMSIIQHIRDISGGVEYITDDYIPQNTEGTIFKDLVYGLAKDENIVLSGYLVNFFKSVDENSIITAMALTKDMQKMMKTFDKFQAPLTFTTECNKQRSQFKRLLRQWITQNRDAKNENENWNHDRILQETTTLISEYDADGWKERYDQIETILMNKSIKYAQAVIVEFEKSLKKPIEDIIYENVQTYGLDYHLAKAYASMARYIKNKHKYIANIMHEHSDGKDRWATWIMCIAVTAPIEWPKIDEEFQNINGESLTDFILRKMANDKTLAETIAAVIDSQFKPTTFSCISIINGAGSTLTSLLPSSTRLALLGLITTPPVVSRTLLLSHLLHPRNQHSRWHSHSHSHCHHQTDMYSDFTTILLRSYA